MKGAERGPVPRVNAGRPETHGRFSVLKRWRRPALITVFTLAYFPSGTDLPFLSVSARPALADELPSPAGAQDGVDTPGEEETETQGEEKEQTVAKKAGEWGKPAKIRLFGSVEFRQSNTALQSWQSMLKRNAGHPLFTPGSRLNSSTTWEQFRKRAEKLGGLDLLRLVNNFWNNWPYREDRDVYGQPDYWASPREFRENSGDCEDYSIAKYFTLRALGVPKENMRIVVLMETIRNLPHAVLVVYMDGDAYVLDNLSRQVLPHSRYRNYEPRFSINEDYRWAHMKPKKRERNASAAHGRGTRAGEPRKPRVSE